MNNAVTYHEFQEEDFEPLFNLSRKLWKEFSDDALRSLLENVYKLKNQKIFIAKDSQHGPVGFVILSIRTDYVEGATTSPTGYLEGIYVEPEVRKLGVARKFIEMGEFWLKENGCTQMGSDTWISDQNSRNFHQKMGFHVEDELVHFLKDIDS